MPILIGELKTHPKKSNWHKVKILVDSGASASIIHERFVSDLPRQKGKGVTWSTMGGQFETADVCKTQLCLPELNSTALINVELHITKQDSKYDVILGRDLCCQLGIVIDFERSLIKWNEAQARVKMRTFVTVKSSTLSTTPDKFNSQLKELIKSWMQNTKKLI